MRSNTAAAGFAVFSLMVSASTLGQPPVLHVPGAAGTSTRIEVMSWSWGVSQTGSGRPVQAAVAASRDVATGQASGKRQHGPLRGPGSGAAAASYAATGLAIGQPLELEFSLPEGAAPWAFDSCAAGVRYPRMEISLEDGVIQVEDALITCPAAALVSGKQKQWLTSNFRLQGKTGHVTLIK